MKNRINDEIDYMVAEAQLETDIAAEIVESIRNKVGKNKYYEEKLALKMLEFYMQEEKVISLYAEAKKNYPILAELMENKRPYLKEVFSEAKRLFARNISK